jgi:peroxiredoxin
LNGEQIPLEAYRNKVVAVVFWGTWCSGSKRALRGLNDLVSEVKGNRFSVLAASLDRESEEEDVRGFIEYAELDHIQYAYSGNESLDEAYLSFQGEDVPHIFVVDEHGTIVLVARSAGAVEDYLEKRGIL